MNEAEVRKWGALQACLREDETYIPILAYLGSERDGKDVYIPVSTYGRRWEAAAKSELHDLSDTIPWAMTNNRAVWRWSSAKGQVYTFIARPLRRYNDDGESVSPAADEVFVISVGENLVVLGAYWTKRDVRSDLLPVDREERDGVRLVP